MDRNTATRPPGGEAVKGYLLLMLIAWVAAYMTGSWWSVGAVFFAYFSGYTSAKEGL